MQVIVNKYEGLCEEVYAMAVRAILLLLLNKFVGGFVLVKKGEITGGKRHVLVALFVELVKTAL